MTNNNNTTIPLSPTLLPPNHFEDTSKINEDVEYYPRTNRAPCKCCYL